MPVAKRNAQRATARYAASFGSHAIHIRKLPCCCCGKRAPSEAHHTITRARGGQRWHLVPVCRDCHGAIHHTGKVALSPDGKRDLLALALELYETRPGWVRAGEGL